MKRLVPAPLLSAALFVLWLLLNQSLSPGNLVLALVVAWLVPLLTRGLRPLRERSAPPRMPLRRSKRRGCSRWRHRHLLVGMPRSPRLADGSC